MINATETQLAGWFLARIMEKGADCARVVFYKSSCRIVETLNGEIDKISRTSDTTLVVNLVNDGRFGSFSTNRLDRNDLEAFADRCLSMAATLEKDPFRKLPDPQLVCRDAASGYETEAFDSKAAEIQDEELISRVLDLTLFGKRVSPEWKLVSEESQLDASVVGIYLIDSQGTECRHYESAFEYSTEVTIEAAEGDLYSGYSWNSDAFLGGLKAEDCGDRALEKACAQIGSEAVSGRTCNMVVDRDVASRMVSPLLAALDGYGLQQNNSFLLDSMGKQLFPEGLTIKDFPRAKGSNQSKYFDKEGVATYDFPIIDKGVVKTYFTDSYIAGKLAVDRMPCSAVHPKLMPWPKEGTDREDLMKLCGSGILVTGFNGGNSNPSTGDFSYGIEGFLFEDGRIVKPVSGMLVTGNFLSLWNNFIASADDSRPYMSKLIPTLAFCNVEFNG